MIKEFRPTATYSISNVATLGINISSNDSYDSGYQVEYAFYDEEGKLKGKVKKTELMTDRKGKFYFTFGNGVYYIDEFIRTNLTSGI